MTREEEIYKAATKMFCTESHQGAFVAGAMWSDKHPKNRNEIKNK